MTFDVAGMDRAHFLDVDARPDDMAMLARDAALVGLDMEDDGARLRCPQLLRLRPAQLENGFPAIDAAFDHNTVGRFHAAPSRLSR